MAQANEDKSLLTRMSDNSELPARPEDAPTDVKEPVDPNREVEPGRKPEEVVQDRETRPAPTKTEEDGGKAVVKYKVSVEGVNGERKVEELTEQEIIDRGLLGKLVTTSNQFPTLQKKYQDILEKEAGKTDAGKAVETVPEKPAPPNQEQIRNAYMAALKESVAAGHIEPDFADAYPDVATNLIYYRDIADVMGQKIEQLLEWVKAEVGQRNAVTVKSKLDGAVESIAKRGDGDKGNPMYKPLRVPETLGKFVAYVYDLDPKVGALTEENMERFWFAFNAPDILNAAKIATEKVDKKPPSKRAASDGSPTRPGVVDPEKPATLLERMTDNALEAEA